MRWIRTQADSEPWYYIPSSGIVLFCVCFLTALFSLFLTAAAVSGFLLYRLVFFLRTQETWSAGLGAWIRELQLHASSRLPKDVRASDSDSNSNLDSDTYKMGVSQWEEMIQQKLSTAYGLTTGSESVSQSSVCQIEQTEAWFNCYRNFIFNYFILSSHHSDFMLTIARLNQGQCLLYHIISSMLWYPRGNISSYFTLSANSKIEGTYNSESLRSGRRFSSCCE